RDHALDGHVPALGRAAAVVDPTERLTVARLVAAGAAGAKELLAASGMEGIGAQDRAREREQRNGSNAGSAVSRRRHRARGHRSASSPSARTFFWTSCPFFIAATKSRTIGSSAFLSYASSFSPGQMTSASSAYSDRIPFTLPASRWRTNASSTLRTMTSGDCSAAAAGTASSALSASIFHFPNIACLLSIGGRAPMP